MNRYSKKVMFVLKTYPMFCYLVWIKEKRIQGIQNIDQRILDLCRKFKCVTMAKKV